MAIGNTKKEMPIPLAIPIAAAAIGAIGKLWGNKKAADAERERQRMIQAEKAKNDAYYRRMINQSWLDTAHGQNMLRVARDEADKMWKREAGATAVTGRTAAADAMAKDKANNLVAETIAQGEAQESMRKDSLEASQRAADSQYAQQQIAEAGAKRDRLSAAGDAILGTGLNIATTTFGGTKLGQSWMGSPAGGGGSVTTPNTSTPALQSMGLTNLTKSPLFETDPNIFFKSLPKTGGYSTYFGPYEKGR